MFDLSNLNDYEFEVLSKDIMQKLLGQDLFIFSRGVDAGVDICDREKNPTVVIQAKHYTNSTYSQLKGSLKKEVKKVYQHHPKNYFVCTSQSLTRKNKLEIAELFGEFMPDISYINLPVTLSGQAFICSGVPAATILPPSSPPPGPMSMM